MVDFKIYSKEELEKMSKEEMTQMILEFQTKVLSESIYDGKKAKLNTSLNIQMEDYKILSF